MSESSIWKKLRAKGFSENATAAIMGNMQAESGLVPYRLQGDFSNGYVKSIEYTALVDNGAIGRQEFVYNGPGGGGYGLCQWTFWSRKAGLYDLAKKRGTSIGDEQIGVDWLFEEICSPEYASVFEVLDSNASMWDMTAAVLRKYERPADMSDAALSLRYAMARDIYDRNTGSAPDPGPEPEPQPEPGDGFDVHIRYVSKGDKGRDVYLLQLILNELGYDVGDCGCDGDFGFDTELALNDFKLENLLPTDGVADADVWQIIFH